MRAIFLGAWPICCPGPPESLVVPTCIGTQAHREQVLSEKRPPFPRIQAIDGRPHFAKLSIDDGKQEEIAAIDPDFEWDVAPVPDGMS